MPFNYGKVEGNMEMCITATYIKSKHATDIEDQHIQFRYSFKCQMYIACMCSNQSSKRALHQAKSAIGMCYKWNTFQN